MHLDNATVFPAAFTMAMDSDGRQHVVVVVKASFAFPENGGATCPVAEDQDPLLMADTFWGDPGHSAPRAEMDFAHIKAHCDVLIEARAHTPNGRPAEQVRVGAKVGGWTKTLDVFGDRVWLSGVGAPSISAQRPFQTMAINYDRAFGGVDRADPDTDPPFANLDNPVGRGWHRAENVARLNGQPLPNIELVSEKVTLPWGTYAPAGFGPVGRGWAARLKHAGTYDQKWQDDQFPFLPKDFDQKYYQAAPEDQQIVSPEGGTDVVLVNLTSEGRTSFQLPQQTMPIYFARRRADDVRINGHMDTLVIRPDARRITMTWRASLPLKRDIFEVPECIVGHRPAGFWRARALGKTYYPKLSEMVKKSRETEAVE